MLIISLLNVMLGFTSGSIFASPEVWVLSSLILMIPYIEETDSRI